MAIESSPTKRGLKFFLEERSEILPRAKRAEFYLQNNPQVFINRDFEIPFGGAGALVENRNTPYAKRVLAILIREGATKILVNFHC